MPLTSLEAIAEKLQENRQNQLEDILRVSGSNSIAKDEYGITTVDEKNVATSLIFKSLNKPKFDINELEKAIDIEVKELMPDIPVPVKDLVPKSLYDDEVATNTDLTNQVEVLNATIEALNTEIDNLKTQIDTEKNNRLNVEQSNTVLVNQSAALNKSIQDLTKQIQTALQKSAEESVIRGSLQAQNAGYKTKIEALIKQIDSLNSIVEGLQAQLGGVPQGQNLQNLQLGGPLPSLETMQPIPVPVPKTENVGGVEITKIELIQNRVTALFRTAANEGTIINQGDQRTLNSTKVDWISGKTIQFTNNTEAPVDISLSANSAKLGAPYTAEIAWLTIPKTKFTLAPGTSEKIEFLVDLSKVVFVTGAGYNRSINSFLGQFILKIQTEEGKEFDKIIPTRLESLNPAFWKY